MFSHGGSVDTGQVKRGGCWGQSQTSVAGSDRELVAAARVCLLDSTPVDHPN